MTNVLSQAPVIKHAAVISRARYLLCCGCHPQKIHTYSVESVVDEMFDVLTHSDLSHELVLVSVHSSQLTNMSKDVLNAISKLFDTK